MKNIFKSILLSCLLLLALGQTTDSNQQNNSTPQSFEVGQQIQSRAINGKVFSSVKVKQLKSKYFFIHLTLNDQYKNIPLKLYIYIEGNPNPILTCENKDIDSCYLPREDVQANKNVLILTSSEQSQYAFKLRTYWSDVEHLLINSSTKFFFAKEDQTQFYHLQLKKTDFHQLRIIIKPETIRSAFDKIKIFGSFGRDSNPSQEVYDFKSIHLWEDAEGIFLYGKQIKDKNIKIFIEGQIQTVYTLSCEIIEKSHHDLSPGQAVHQYLEPGQDFTYHAKFVAEQNKSLEFDEYVFTFSGFSGKLNLGFFLDEKRKIPLDIQPFAYLSDAQYIFKKSQIQKKMKKGLYIYVHALQRKSVYSINFNGRIKTAAIKLNQNIYEFLEIDRTSQQLSYFQIFQWANDTRQGNLEYSISLTNVIGDHELQFRICLKTFQQCTDPVSYENATEITSAIVTTIGTKKNFLLSLSRENLQKLNVAQSSITVVIIVKNTNKQNKSSLAAIQYRPQNRLYFLRQGKPHETRIKQDQYKIFKYTNQDPFLKEIRVYVSQISGKIDVYSLREDPKPNTPYGKQQTSSVLSFTKQLTSKPIYIVVQGKQEAIFSIQVVSIHKSDSSLSALALTQDLSFSLRVKPQGSQILQVVPIFDAIYFEYTSTKSVLVCAIDQSTGDCEKDYRPKLNKVGQINIEKFNQRMKMFKVLNPSQTQTAQVTVVYHSKDYVHCEQRQIGSLYYQTIQKDEIAQEGFQNNCFSFNLMQKKDLTLTLSRVDIGEVHYAIAVCNQLYKAQSEVSETLIKIPYGKISKLCQKSQQKVLTLMVSPHKQQSQHNKVIIPSKLKYLLEYSGDKVITIPDGVAYDFEAKTSQSPVRIFYYDLVNKKNTTIKLVQYSGYGTFSVHIVPSGKKQSEVNSSNYDLSFSKGDMYFTNPTMTVTKQSIQAKNCDQCTLIIKVYSVEDVGTLVHFGLEVIQNHNQLEDHKTKDSYLAKGSFDFYSYTTLDSKNQGSLIVQINDNNRQCSRIYLSDEDYPDEKKFMVKQEGNQLIYKDVQPQQDYYISVEAVEQCPYSITISNTQVPITKLRRGSNSPLTLKKGEVKYFLIEHLQKKEFKILSILEFGQTQIYLNKTNSRQVEDFLLKSGQNEQYKKFQVKSDYPNRLVLHENNSYLAEQSYYLIAVQGKTQTKGYLFYGDSQTTIQIISETAINDLLSLKGEIFRGQFYGEGKITLQVTVLSGEVNVKVQQPQNFDKLQKVFAKNKTVYDWKFQVKSSKDNFFLRDPIEVTFTAKKQPTVYSFKFIKQDASAQSRQEQITVGQPNYVSLFSKVQKNTITGVLTHGEGIFISTRIDTKQKLYGIEINALVENKKISFTKTIVRNIMKIEFENVTSSAVNYTLQITTPQDFTVIVYQNSGLNLLAANTEVIIQGKTDYVLYPQGSVLLDVFQCKGNAKILYGNSKSALDSVDSKSLDLIGMPDQPHAIKILNPGTTFLRIQSEQSYLRWLPIDSDKGKGMGYLDYDIGGISYSGSLLQLTVQWDSVFAKRDTKTKVSSIEYVLIVGSDTASVKGAINCENYNDPNLLFYHYSTGQSSIRTNLEIGLSKSEIIAKYSSNQNLFIGIVAEVMLKVQGEKQEQLQHYRFVYHTQEVPLQVFREYAVTSKDVWILALIGAGAVFLLSATIFICIKKVVPILQRLKQGNMFVEQTKEQKQFDVIPPSSDRNQVNNDIETDEAMK